MTGSSQATSTTAKVVGALHNQMVFSRRVRKLSEGIASRLPKRGTVLDVGAGSGDMARSILSIRPELSIEGVDVLVRPDTAIPVQKFDGKKLPFADGHFDYAILVDVLHHTDDPGELLGEVARVARRVIVKDHYRNGPLAGLRLRFMDWVGNAAHGVRLPYNYLSRSEWKELWSSRRLNVLDVQESLGLYAFPANAIFESGLHFIAELESSPAPKQDD